MAIPCMSMALLSSLELQVDLILAWLSLPIFTSFLHSIERVSKIVFMLTNPLLKADSQRSRANEFDDAETRAKMAMR